MKMKYFLLGAVAALMLAASACSDDKDSYKAVDGKSPDLEMEASEIGSRIGRTFYLKGKVTDADGLSHIKLTCLPLYLDKTIDLLEIYGEPLKEYELDYKVDTDLTEAGDFFTIDVTAVDVLGNATSRKVAVDMDGDVDAPVFKVAPSDEITVLLKDKAVLDLSFTVTDDRGLASVTAAIPAVDYTETITSFPDPCEYTFSSSVELPAANADYTLTVSIADNGGNTLERECVIHVSDMPDFPRMWLADVATAAELNSDVMGVPMLIDRTAPYEYEARYYNEKAGTEIFFLPQRTDFAPICIGLDPADNTRITSDASAARPLVLDQEGVYYLIRFSTLSRTFSMETYSVDEATDPIPHPFGSDLMDINEDGSEFGEFWFGYTTDGPGAVTRFEQDARNPHLFRLPEPLELKAGRHSGFIFHNYHPLGWWNYCTWRADSEQDPEIVGYYGKATNPLWKGQRAEDLWFKPAIPADGKYNLVFDAHLGRAKIVPANK